MKKYERNFEMRFLIFVFVCSLLCGCDFWGEKED